MLQDYCPYCDKEVEINHDDGYDDGEIYNDYCGHCGKYFVYTTTIIISHSLYQADCLNGSDHNFVKTNTYPPEYAKIRCDICGEIKREKQI